MKVIFLLFTLVGLAGGGYYLKHLPSSEASNGPDPAALFDVRRGELTIMVTENGYLKAKNSVKLQPKFRGEGLITWLIEEGTAVEEGEKLVDFEKKELESKIDELESQITQQEVQIEAAKAKLEISRSDSKADIEKAELGLEIARMQLEQYSEGEQPNQLRKLELAQEKAASEAKRSAEKFERLPELRDEGFFTDAEVEEEEIRVREAKLAAETAQLDLDLYKKYTAEIETRQKDAALKDAERTLENARKNTEISQKEMDANVARQEAQLEASRHALEKQAEDLENMTMRAPQAGIVHYGDPGSSWSRERVKLGNRVYRGSTVITLPDLSEMEVLLKVHEADVDRVKEDQVVSITIDTYPGEFFTGRVTHIAAVATSSGWDESTKAFRITVAMDPNDVELRAGISAKVEVEVERLEDVLHVPIHAVHVEEGEHFCFVFEGGETLKRSVTVGKNNSHFVVVTEGLVEGEKVLLFDPRENSTPDASAQEGPESGTTPAEGGAGEPVE